MSLNLKKFFGKALDPLGIFKTPSSHLPDISAAGPQNYIRNLNVLRSALKASAAGVIGPGVTRAIAEQLSAQGLEKTNLGRDLATGALTIPGLEVESLAGGVAPELQDLQTSISVAKAGIPRAPNTATGVVTGAAEGFVTGGFIGAAVGAVGGLIKAKQGQANVNSLKKVTADATRLASPENFVANTNALLGTAREQTFIASQQQELNAKSKLADTGMLDTGIGTQKAISASVLPEVAALRTAVGGATGITKGQTQMRLGAPIRQPNDTLIKALTAAGMFAGSYFSPEATAKRQAATQAAKEKTAANSSIIQPTFMDQP